jgi:hypothetical protein
LVTSKNLDLVAKNGHLKLQVDASSEAGKEAAEDGNDDLAHGLDATGHGPEWRGFLGRMGFMEGTGSRRPCVGSTP